MNKRAFVLLSGGMDSTTCLYKAIIDFAPSEFAKYIMPKHDSLESMLQRGEFDAQVDWVEAISINYGQRHIKEAEYAKATCEKFGIPHSVLNIKDILSGKGVMLADANVQIPNISYADIKGVSPTYVPFRNGTLLSLITAHAQKWVNEQIEELCKPVYFDQGHANMKRHSATKAMKNSVGIYFGAHAEDAANWAYPDCTPEFIGAMANAIYIGSYQAIRLYTPLQWADKRAVVELGTRLGVDWRGTWSCYAGGEKHCGTCPTCRARKGAFQGAGISDPTEYSA